MPLTDLTCRHANPADKPYKLTDAKGLHLLVNPSGSKLWRLSYRHAGKQKTLAFGAYPQVTLEAARQKREAARRQIALKVDPAVMKLVTAPAGVSFAEMAREHHDIWKRDKSQSHIARVWARMERDALAVIGPRPIAEITPVEVLAMVRRVEARGAFDVARRLRQKCSEVFAYAIATGHAQNDPCASIGKALVPLPRVKHMAMVGPARLPALADAVRNYHGDPIVQAALRFTLLTAARTAEIRFARWEEIEGDLWRIPASRMKMRRDHLVPLAQQARAILEELERGTEGYIFPGRGGVGVLSQTAMLMALRPATAARRRSTAFGGCSRLC